MAPVNFKGSGHGATAPELTASGRPPPGDPLVCSGPSDGDPTISKRRYPFGCKLYKESLETFSNYPAVPGALEEITFSKFKSVFLSGSIQFTFSDIYSFAIDFIMLIKYSF